VVIGFEQSSNISHAYGVTVCGVMILTTSLYIIVMTSVWHSHWLKIVPFFLFYIVDGPFFASNLTKIPQGGWVSIMLASVFSSVMLCWYFGETQLAKYFPAMFQPVTIEAFKRRIKGKEPRKKELAQMGEEKGTNTAIELPMDEVQDAKQIQRVPGVGVFVGSDESKTPRVALSLIHILHCLPETVIFVTVNRLTIPFVSDEDRIVVTDCGDGIYKIVGRYGYAEGKVKITSILQSAENAGFSKIKQQEIIYFVHREKILLARTSCLSYLRMIPLVVYKFFKHTLGATTHHVSLPSSGVIEIAVQVVL